MFTKRLIDDDYYDDEEDMVTHSTNVLKVDEHEIKEICSFKLCEIPSSLVSLVVKHKCTYWESIIFMMSNIPLNPKTEVKS